MRRNRRTPPTVAARVPVVRPGFLPDFAFPPDDLAPGLPDLAPAPIRRNCRILPTTAARTPEGRFGFLPDDFFPPADFAPGFLPFASAPPAAFDRATACLFVLFRKDNEMQRPCEAIAAVLLDGADGLD